MNDKSTFGIGRLYEAKEYRRKLEDDDQKRCVLYSCFVSKKISSHRHKIKNNHTENTRHELLKTEVFPSCMR